MLFNRIKLERIAQKNEELEELAAAYAHMQDQIAALEASYQELEKRLVASEKLRKEAMSLSRDAAAQNIAVEVRTTTLAR